MTDFGGRGRSYGGRPHEGRSGGYGGGRGGGRGGGFGGGRGEGRGGPSGRGVLSRAELQQLLLSLIGSDARHGYDLIREIKHLSDGAYAPSSGVVYPTLAALEELGEVTAQSEDGGRRAYTITDAGREQLVGKDAEIAALKERIAALSEGDPERQAPIRRAMGNLKAVLGDIGPDRQRDLAHEIAAQIDEAARKIERLG